MTTFKEFLAISKSLNVIITHTIVLTISTDEVPILIPSRSNHQTPRNHVFMFFAAKVEVLKFTSQHEYTSHCEHNFLIELGVPRFSENGTLCITF